MDANPQQFSPGVMLDKMISHQRGSFTQINRRIKNQEQNNQRGAKKQICLHLRFQNGHHVAERIWLAENI